MRSFNYFSGPFSFFFFKCVHWQIGVSHFPTGCAPLPVKMSPHQAWSGFPTDVSTWPCWKVEPVPKAVPSWAHLWPRRWVSSWSTITDQRAKVMAAHQTPLWTAGLSGLIKGCTVTSCLSSMSWKVRAFHLQSFGALGSKKETAYWGWKRKLGFRMAKPGSYRKK